MTDDLPTHRMDIDGRMVALTRAELAEIKATRALPAAPPLVAEPALSPAQLAGALYLGGHIGAPEAEAFAASGAIPPALRQKIVAALDAAGVADRDKTIAMIKLTAALEYPRHSPLTPIIGAALNLDAAGLDALFAAGRAI